jgi:two-component system chemotaxis response regulator CheB
VGPKWDQPRDIVVIGTSSGGVQAVLNLVARLEPDLPASLFVVIHTSPSSPGVLGNIVTRAGTLPASLAADGEEIRQGQVYLAPPDHHLLIEHGKVRVVRGPQENGFRPAVDPMFRTASRAYGPRVVGIILSGGLDDGTRGLFDVKRAGGVTVVQDPDEALIPMMPLSAIQNVEVDHILPVAEIASLISRLARNGQPVAEVPNLMPNHNRDESDRVETGIDSTDVDYEGPPSALTCPACGGALWASPENEPLGFSCHEGHGYTSETLALAQAADIELALWTAVRTLDEKAVLHHRMAERAASRDLDAIAQANRQTAAEAARRADLIRSLLGRTPSSRLEEKNKRRRRQRRLKNTVENR